MQSQTEFKSAIVLKNTDHTKPYSPLLKYRFMITYRFLLAIVGGYVLASYSAIVIAKLFSEHPSDAAMSATLLAFCIYCAVFIWVFMVKNTFKTSLGVILPTAILFILSQIMGS